MVRTLNELFVHAVTEHGQNAMFRSKVDGRWVDVSSQEFERAVTELSQGLVSLGVGPGDRVALLSENRLEWAMTDLATLAAGAVLVPLYPTLMPHQIQFILEDCQPKLAFGSTAGQIAKLSQIRDSVPSLTTIVAFEPVDRANVLTADKVRELGAVHEGNHPGDAQRRRDAVGPDDLATIIYTSGTTGEPKGVMLTHANIVQNVRCTLERLSIGPDDSCLSFLPLSHIFERMAGHFTMIYRGVSIAYAESIEAVAANLREVRPTIMVAVPRLYEKIYARILDAASQGGGAKRRIFFWARRVGARVTAAKASRSGVGSGLALQARVADALVFKKLRARTGGRLRFFVSGGAPLAREIAEFFYAAGLPIMEGYGLTETSPVIAVNTFEDFRPGSVGKPVPHVEVSIAEDGEILTRSPCVMRGYYRQPEATAEMMVDGWFRTGDIGYLDEDGFLFITDRKKDVIVTAGGKNLAPQPIENELKLSKYVTEAVLIGDKRRYVVALIVPDFEQLEAYALREEIPHESRETLLASKHMETLFQTVVDKVNANHPSYEQIKYFRLLGQEFTLESGELTPSLKVKRKVVQEKYADLIESMYAE